MLIRRAAGAGRRAVKPGAAQVTDRKRLFRLRILRKLIRQFARRIYRHRFSDGNNTVIVFNPAINPVTVTARKLILSTIGTNNQGRNY
ncbi:hypothetical protein J4732_13870 [Serratia marcescens]|uniref:Uncharacterized protein n=1 Tax=Serratia marcescens TaxID=615 RepID=A0A939SNT6_SERMA|nr:hypothetical protein [Serratia marcescens]